MLKLINISSTYSQYIQPNTQIQFSNLSHADFSNKDLSGCLFFACIIDACKFQTALLKDCVFRHCYITNSNQKPQFDTNLSTATFESCNFSPKDDFNIVARDAINTKINRILATMQEDFSIKILDELRSAVKLDDPNTDIREVFAFTHLFHAQELIIRNAYFFYLHLFKRPDAKAFLGEYYNDVLTHFLSFCIKDLIRPDYVNLFDDIYFNNKAPFCIEDKIIKALVDKINLDSPEEQLKGLEYAIKLMNYKEELVNFYPIEKVASLLIHEDLALAEKAYLLIRYIMDIVWLDNNHPLNFNLITFQKRLEPYVEKALRSPIPSHQLQGLEIINKGNYWDWEKQAYVIALMNSEEEKVRELAVKVVGDYEYGKELG